MFLTEPFVKKAIQLLLVFTFLALLCPTAFCLEKAANNSILDLGNPVATFEGGKLYKAGSLNVIELHGSYREMGRQYGTLMKKELNEIYNQMNGDFGKIEGITYDSMLKKGRMLFEYYPQKYKEIVIGISDTCCVDQLLLREAFAIDS